MCESFLLVRVSVTPEEHCWPRAPIAQGARFACAVAARAQTSQGAIT